MTSADLHEPSDAEYLGRARAGDPDAFAALFARHHHLALRAATRWTSPDRADDLVAEAFARIYGLLRDGRGPTVTFRAYLLAAIRRLHVDRARQEARHTWMGDLSVLGELVSVDDGSEQRFRTEAVGRAFRSLPERWQEVLWFTAIEGLAVHEVAELLGLKPHAVSQLGFRAREGLRQRYLAEHLGGIDDETCARIGDLLPGYVRGGLSGGRQTKVAGHLAGCLRCSAAAAEIAAINRDLAALLLPAGAGVLAGPVRPGHPRVIALTVLGTAAILALLLATLPSRHDPGDSRTVPAVRVAPATPAAAASAPLPSPVSPRATGTAPPSPAPLPTSVGTPTVAVAAQVVDPRPTPTPLSSPSPPVPSALAEDLSLGEPSAVRVDPARAGVLHVWFPVRRAVPGAVVELRVTPAPDRIVLHRERQYGDWRCSAARSGLRCLLGADAADADLAVDLWVRGPGTVSLRLSLPAVPDPRPEDNRVSVRLLP